MDFDKKPERDVLSSNLKSPSHPGPGAKNGESDLFLTKEGNAMEILAKSADRNLLLELSGELDHHGARTALREMEKALDEALPR